MSEHEDAIHPEPFVAEPFAYFVPSSWSHEGSADSDGGAVDFFRHPGGGEFYVERLTMTRKEDFEAEFDPADMLLGLGAPEDERSAVVRLASGFTMISYFLPVEDDANSVGLYCELCGSFAPGRIGVLRYSSRVSRVDLANREVVFWAHVVRQCARLSRFTN